MPLLISKRECEAVLVVVEFSLVRTFLNLWIFIEVLITIFSYYLLDFFIDTVDLAAECGDTENYVEYEKE